MLKNSVSLFFVLTLLVFIVSSFAVKKIKNSFFNDSIDGYRSYPSDVLNFDHDKIDIHDSPLNHINIHKDEAKKYNERESLSKDKTAMLVTGKEYLNGNSFQYILDDFHLDDLDNAVVGKIDVEVAKIIKEVGKFNFVAQKFKSAYGDIPGDVTIDSLFATRVVNAEGFGNGDGRISDIRESLLFWRHLSYVGAIDILEKKKEINWDTDIMQYIPNIGLEGVVVTPIYVASLESKNKHMFMVSVIEGNSFSGGALTPKQAMNIDILLDDGLALTSFNDVESGVLAANSSAKNIKPCFIKGQYDLSHNDKSCKLYIGSSF